MSRKKYIDRTDIELLNVLKENPEMTVTQLGNEVDLSPGPTHTRLIKLEEKGFFKKAIELDYSKFGIEEHIFSFNIEGDKNQVDRFNSQSVFNEVVGALSHARDILVISIELLQNEKNKSNKITVHYYPRYSDETIKQRDSKSLVKIKASDKNEVKNLLKDFIKSPTTYQVIKRQVTNPHLDIGHVIRKKPE